MTRASVSNIYTNFMLNYTQSLRPSKKSLSSHEKSELKEVYDAIVRQSKDSPLYMIDRTGKSQRYALNLKEDAQELKKAVTSLTSSYSDNLLDQKVASSDNEDIITAEYIGGAESKNTSFDISVSKLASSQINIGRFFANNDTIGLPSGTYSFDLGINNSDYEFQFSIHAGDTNRNVADRLTSLITRSNIGLNASVMDGERNTSAIRLESNSTGENADGGLTFKISDDATSMKSGTVTYFGLNEVAHEPTNAEFTVNGDRHSAYSNTFVLDKTYQVNLKGITAEDENVHIDLKPNLEALTYSVNHLAGAYNDFIQRAAEYTEMYGRSNKIMKEMNHIAMRYNRSLDSIGLNMQKDGSIMVNDNTLLQIASDEEGKNDLSVLGDFANSLIHKSNEVSLDPMKYTEQKLVTYRKPGVYFANPYMTSMYSGMLFSSVC